MFCPRCGTGTIVGGWCRRCGLIDPRLHGWAKRKMPVLATLLGLLVFGFMFAALPGGTVQTEPTADSLSAGHLSSDQLRVLDAAKSVQPGSSLGSAEQLFSAWPVIERTDTGEYQVATYGDEDFHITLTAYQYRVLRIWVATGKGESARTLYDRGDQ